MSVTYLYDADEPESFDLAEEHRAKPGKVSIWSIDDRPDRVDRVECLYYPEIGRAGVVWGANATWTDCCDPEDAVRRVCVTGKLLDGFPE